MYFAHTPKIVLVGSSPVLRQTGDRAAALGAEIVVVEPVPVVGLDVAVGDLDGFDVAVVGVADASSAAADALHAARVLSSGLRRGALVIVSSDEPVEAEGRRLADDLAHRTGLIVGAHFDVVGVERGSVAWQTGAEGAETTRYLIGRLGAAAPVPLS
jgi:hypothetical protein